MTNLRSAIYKPVQKRIGVVGYREVMILNEPVAVRVSACIKLYFACADISKISDSPEAF